MLQGIKVNMLYVYLVCLSLMEQVENNWFFKKCCIVFYFSQKVYIRWVVVILVFINLFYFEIGKWRVVG